LSGRGHRYYSEHERDKTINESSDAVSPRRRRIMCGALELIARFDRAPLD
jgi:hypothetical protein